MAIKKINMKGGYTFRRMKGAPEDTIVSADMPSKVILPLKQGFGGVLQPVVKTGDHVTAGQILGRDDDGLSSPVLASVSGEVTETGKMNYAGEKKVPFVVIIPDKEQEEAVLEGCSAEWQNLASEKIGELIYVSGVSALGKSGLPTAYNSSIVNREDISHIIIQGTDSDLWEPLPSLLLNGQEQQQNFINGVGILQKYYSGAEASIVLGGKFGSLLQSLDSGFSGKEKVQIYRTSTKYPVGMEEILVPAILGKEFPTTFTALHMGVLVLNIQTVLHVYEAVAGGKSLTDRVIALAGPGYSSNPHVRVKIGTAVSEIVGKYTKEGRELRYVCNSLTRGAALANTDQPIGKTCSSIIGLVEENQGEPLGFAMPGFTKDSFSNTFASTFLPTKKVVNTNLHGEGRGCINCGFCVDVCPVRIMPNLLHRYALRGVIDETLVRYKIFTCIQCNLCTYVCPSKIQIADLIKQGKKKLIQEGLDPSPAWIEKLELKGVTQEEEAGA